MSPAFSALVDLTRSARSSRVMGADLVIELTATPESRALKDMVDEGNWATTSYVQDSEYTNPWSGLADGSAVKLAVHGVARNNQVIANNLGTMLRLNRGAYLRSPPEEFYLLDENFASWEVATHTDLVAYRGAQTIRTLLERVADASTDRPDTGGEHIILAGRKLVVPVVYNIASLSRVSTDEHVAELQAAIFSDHQKEQRLEIVKRVLVRRLHALPENQRFSTLLATIGEIREAFLADYEIYAASFSFEKAREDFERKKLDYIVKAGAATSDVLSKLAAIPVGQGLLASQMKVGEDSELINAALLFASIAFAAVSTALLYNQFNTLTQLERELETEVKLLRDHTPSTYDKMKDVIQSLRSRLAWHRWLVPGAMAVLIVASTLFTFAAYHSSIPSTSPDGDRNIEQSSPIKADRKLPGGGQGAVQ